MAGAEGERSAASDHHTLLTRRNTKIVEEQKQEQSTSDVLRVCCRVPRAFALRSSLIIQTTKKTGKGHAAAHAASVDDAAGVEPHDPDNKPETDNQDLDEYEESSHDANSNPSFDEISNDNPEGELEPWSTTQREQCTKRMTCWQQTESRRGSAVRPGFTGSRQG